MWQEKVYFYNKRNEKLAGVLEYSETERPRGIFLLLCPHPLLGGDSENNVIAEICAELRKNPCIFLRFDYHGSGESEVNLPSGKHLLDYYEELEDTQNTYPFYEDALAALDFLGKISQSWDIPIEIIGYSFGGYLGLRYFSESFFVFAIAPPFAKYETLAISNKNNCCLCAQNDFVSYNDIPQNINYETAQGADHFFRGKEYLVSEWISSKIFIKEFV